VCTNAHRAFCDSDSLRVLYCRETIPAGAVLPVTLMATVHSPRALRRRRREIELEARRLATADFSSSDSSPPRESSDDARPAPMLPRTKAHSASPAALQPVDDQRRERRKQRRSYRQYVRNKRSRSREKARAASADRHRFVDDQSQDGSSLSQATQSHQFPRFHHPLLQVHWKVHKMPYGGGNPVDPSQDQLDVVQKRLQKAQQRMSLISQSPGDSSTAPSTRKRSLRCEER
jgi:hypothetical protein